jgi:membrane protease YdiL (CAAX protease family)
MEVSAHRITLLSAFFISIGVLYSLIVLLGLKLNLIFEKDSLMEGTSLLSVLLLFLVSIVVATVEEIVFRGAALSYLLIRLKPLVSILLISIVFSLGHVQYSGLLPYITAFIFGIVTSILVIKTNTLYYAIGLHCGWNFFFGVHSLYFDLNIKTLPFWGSKFELMEIGILILILFSFLIYARNHNLSQATDT